MSKKPAEEAPKSQPMVIEPPKPTSYSINILPSPEPESKPKNTHKRKEDESLPEREDLKQVKVSPKKDDSETMLTDTTREVETPTKGLDREKVEVEKEFLASPNFSASAVSVKSSQNESMKSPQSGGMKSPVSSSRKIKYRYYTNSNDDDEEEAEPINLGSLEITNTSRSNVNRSTPVKTYEQSYHNNNKPHVKNEVYQNKTPTKDITILYQNTKVYERSLERAFEKSPERSNIGGNPLGKPLDKPYRSLLEASIWQNEDPTGWYMSEKLAGVRCFWDGERMWSGSRQSQHIAPKFFTKDFPKSPLDGQLWTGRSAFALQKCTSFVRRSQPVDSEWKQVRFMVFDAPELNSPFKERYEKLKEVIGKIKSPYLAVLEHKVCKGVDELYSELINIKEGGGEGLMIRDPKSLYEKKKSKTLLDIKTLDE